MDLRHEFTVPASVEETWAALNDIESVAGCFPGAQVTSVEGDTFQGTVKVKLGPIALVYNGTGTFVEKDESAHTMKIEAKGKDKRGNGTAGANVVATLGEAAAGTRVEVVTDLSITGKPAQFGRGVIQDVSDKLLGQFTACLEQKVGSADTAGETAAAESAPAAEASAVADAATGQAKAKQEAAPPHQDPVPPAPVPPQQTARPGAPQDDAFDLGAAVLPVVAKTYWREAVIAVLGLVLIWRTVRRN